MWPEVKFLKMTRADAITCNTSADDALAAFPRDGEGFDLALAKVDQMKTWLAVWEATARELGYFYRTGPADEVTGWVKRSDMPADQCKKLDAVMNQMKAARETAERNGLAVVQVTPRRSIVVRIGVAAGERGGGSFLTGKQVYGPDTRERCEIWVVEEAPKQVQG